MSGRMNWDRVHREDRAWRAARSAPSGSWQPGDSWEPHDPLEVAWRPRAKTKQRRPKNRGQGRSGSMVTDTSQMARQRYRRREWEEIRRRQSRCGRRSPRRLSPPAPGGPPSFRALEEQAGSSCSPSRRDTPARRRTASSARLPIPTTPSSWPRNGTRCCDWSALASTSPWSTWLTRSPRTGAPSPPGPPACRSSR